MKRLKLAVIALFTLVTVSNVNAQDENNPWAIGFGVNVVDFYLNNTSFTDKLEDHIGSSDWNFLPSVSRITAEKYLDKGFSLQFSGTINKITHKFSDGDSDFLYYSLGLNAKYDLNNLIGDTGWFDPFVYLGGDYVSADSMNEGMLGVGFGFNIWVNENIGFNYQHGSKYGFSNKIQDHIQTSAGIVIRFGGKDTDGDGVYDKDDACPDVAGLVEFNGCPDADGDGIKDSDDACPNAAGLAAMNGCPDADGDGVADKDDMCANAKGTKANKGCPDSDGDGVLDKDDKCASTSGPSANNGCPWPDTDGDGVLDKDDNCKNEVGPASNSGCPVVVNPLESLPEITKDINFNLDSAVITSDAASKLDKIYNLISSVDNVTFVIEGHADSLGNDTYNKYLSKRRAESAKKYLVKKGMDASKLETKGYGEDNPIADNDTEEGRAQNRRVVIKLNDM
ncbi:OmpA family protein [Polaribacter porphyrae]|uniref:Cell envelope biogenesis protein OmpA n=1 Tax=Polaribacter porphyrae TaxID=1137780 RepID=A0A2S7WS82_9FLAO|nr:OmpA family protein [Polaribacter porphyrae]PQJ80450.1 cell envelope biogenesis protein OmpA [Polaribacter porphyrae]